MPSDSTSRNAVILSAPMLSTVAIGSTGTALVARFGDALDDLVRRFGRPAIVSTFDRDLHFISSDGQGLLSLGLYRGDVVGQTLTDIIGTNESEAVTGLQSAMTGTPSRYEWSCRGRTFQAHAEPLRDHAGNIAGVISFAFDITEQRRVEPALRDSREERRRLIGAMNQIQENERRRIAREIHDELGQRLTALRLDLGMLRGDLRKAETVRAEGRIAAMLELIDETIATVRRVATELRPAILDDFGLRAAIEQEITTFAARTSIDVSLVVVPEDLAVDSDRATTIYRIIQESLTNIARHSGATHADLRVEARDRRIEVELRDNGRGIRPEELSDPLTLGILGLRERAYAFGGEVIIEGIADKGTRVFVSIPG
jgi:signal transduction histidine kinase